MRILKNRLEVPETFATRNRAVDMKAVWTLKKKQMFSALDCRDSRGFQYQMRLEVKEKLGLVSRAFRV